MGKVDGFGKKRYHSGEGADLLTLQEVCELLKVGKAYIYSLTHLKKIPHIKMGGHLRFRGLFRDRRWSETLGCATHDRTFLK